MTYAPANQLATVNQQAIELDADGNMINGILKGQLTQFNFDSRNRLTQAGNTTYRYDAENHRIAVNDTQYVINSQPSLSQVLVRTKGNGEVTYYVYGLGLIGEESAGNYFSYHFDYRGSTVALTNAIGQLVDRVAYSAYGELLTQPTYDTPFLFNGMYGVMSDDNGLYYMRARFYSAEIKRFLNRDVLLGSVGEGQSLNRFGFVEADLVKYIDPFGLERYCGQCANEDCLLYGGNVCDSESNILSIYNDAREERIRGHQEYPGEVNSQMRHCVTSCTLSSKYGNDVIRIFGATNELQGLILHDIPNIRRRILGETDWAFQLDDLLSNENGFSCSQLNTCPTYEADRFICETCCERHVEN